MDKKKLNIVVVSAGSLPLAYKIRDIYGSSATIHCKEEGENTTPIHTLDETVKTLFPVSDVLIFIGALGICVRSIAPYIRDKYVDPAVICIDSTGKHVVSVLSGHIGGANSLTETLAVALGAEPVITTQSDNQGFWALDTLADRFGWTQKVIVREEVSASSMNQCIAAFVNGKPTALLLDIRTHETDYIEKSCPAHVDIYYRLSDIDFNRYDLLLAISPFIHPEIPIPSIIYIPPVLHLGIGCKKGVTGTARLAEQITETLQAHRLYPEALADVSSIDLKKEEPVLQQYTSEYLHRPFITYPADVLDAVNVPNPSDKVKQTTQSYSISEAAALHRADDGILLLEKQKGKCGECNDFTYAVAIPKALLRQGHIEIVGAGPGDPDLISIRGRRMLEKADLILYAGSLVPKELTFCAKKGATVRSSADMNLDEQFALMKDFYDKGLFVVRLHTGDPCIYGAIQEQMAFFDQYRMSYHITPGISSFQAAAAALRSQFTIPEKVQTIILTRGEGRTPMLEKEHLHKLAASQSTMCIFLSAGIADQVQAELLQHYAPETPVAACYKLTWPDERIYRGELKDLARIVKDNKLTLTTLLVVGDAIDNRKGLSRLYADEFKHLFRK